MEIGRDSDSTWKNMWPIEKDAPGFKNFMLDFFEVRETLLFKREESNYAQVCHSLQFEMMRSIALGLDLDEHFFDEKVDQKCHNLRLLSYPPIKTSLLENEDQARAGAHSGTALEMSTVLKQC